MSSKGIPFNASFKVGSNRWDTHQIYIVQSPKSFRNSAIATPCLPRLTLAAM